MTTHLDKADILSLIGKGTPCGGSEGAGGLGCRLNAGIVTSGPGLIEYSLLLDDGPVTVTLEEEVSIEERIIVVE